MEYSVSWTDFNIYHHLHTLAVNIKTEIEFGRTFPEVVNSEKDQRQPGYGSFAFALIYHNLLLLASTLWFTNGIDEEIGIMSPF